MRIVHLRSSFDVGLGYDTLSWPLEQLKLGHDVRVITTDRASASAAAADTISPEDSARLNLPSFEVHGLKVYRLRSSRFKYDDVVLPKGGKELLERLKPDVVQVTGSKELMPLFAAKNKSRLAYKLFMKEDQYDFPASTPIRRFLIWFEYIVFRRFLCQWMYNHCDAVMETSMAGIRFLKKYHHIDPKIEIRYTPVCVDLSRFYPDIKKRKSLRSKTGLKDHDKVIISTGKIVPLKRFELLIEALSKVPKSANVQAWLIGGCDKKYHQSLSSLAARLGCSDRLKFMDNVPHEEIPTYQNAADIGFWNRSTSSIQEAMSCALPTITSRYVATVLPEYEACELFETNNADSLAQSITRLASDASHSKMISKRCLKMAKKRFDASKQAKELISFYKKFMDR